jgi:hypothetical protein
MRGEARGRVGMGGVRADRRIAGLAGALALAGCAAVPPPQTVSSAPAQAPMASAYGKAPELMGETARALIAAFGPPRLDIREETMRKLQFANGRCVLDAYLYPKSKGREPVVTHVDSRSPDGVDVDPRSCAAALKDR